MNYPKNYPIVNRIMAIIVLLTAVGLSNPSVALAKATVIHDNYSVPVDEVIYSDCAGEEIHFIGEFHVSTHTTIDGKGRFHTTFVGNDHQVTAVGLSTGNLYHRVGATHESMNLVGQLPYQISYTNSFHFIGQGMAANTIEIDVVRLSIDKNGESTIVFENRILECK
ncbi:MAG TPA: hypothetical protein P5121_39550 [Caldilineaceae bacterium]|nr:hypothetical protein [Caldilineaceae bacterium]